jgi:hypothetical protein
MHIGDRPPQATIEFDDTGKDGHEGSRHEEVARVQIKPGVAGCRQASAEAVSEAGAPLTPGLTAGLAVGDLGTSGNVVAESMCSITMERAPRIVGRNTVGRPSMPMFIVMREREQELRNIGFICIQMHMLLGAKCIDHGRNASRTLTEVLVVL